MQFKNKKTGVIVEIDCEATGDWEPIEAPKAPKKKTARKTEKAEEPVEE